MIYLILGIIKIIDNIILTAKSIATYSNKKLLCAVLVTVSQFLFYTVVKEIITDNSMLSTIVVSISSGLGTYLAFDIVDKFKKDSKWMFVLCSSDVEDIKKLCNYLVEHNIKYQANYGLTRKGENTINVIAFSKTKNESRLIEKYLEETESKYLKEIMK